MRVPLVSMEMRIQLENMSKAKGQNIKNCMKIANCCCFNTPLLAAGEVIEDPDLLHDN